MKSVQVYIYDNPLPQNIDPLNSNMPCKTHNNYSIQQMIDPLNKDIFHNRLEHWLTVRSNIFLRLYHVIFGSLTTLCINDPTSGVEGSKTATHMYCVNASIN